MRLLLAALLLVHGAAMGQTFACQHIRAGGLAWEGGRWVPSGFNQASPFFLKIEKGTLTADSVAKAVSGLPDAIRCESDGGFRGRFSCFDRNGGFLFFDPTASSGSVSQLFGAVKEAMGTRDPLTVSAFTCQQM